MRVALAILLASIFVSTEISAQSTVIPPQIETAFLGMWRATDSTSGIEAVRIVKIDPLHWTAQVWGRCQPKGCDWGSQPFRVLQQAGRGPGFRAVAVWPLRDGSGNRFLTFRFDGSDLMVDHYAVSRGSLAYYDADSRLKKER